MTVVEKNIPSDKNTYVNPILKRWNVKDGSDKSPLVECKSSADSRFICTRSAANVLEVSLTKEEASTEIGKTSKQFLWSQETRPVVHASLTGGYFIVPLIFENI